jgi:hypothetical protein
VGFFVGRQGAVERDIQAQLNFDGTLAGIDRVFAQFNLTDAVERHSEFDGSGLTASVVVL